MQALYLRASCSDLDVQFCQKPSRSLQAARTLSMVTQSALSGLSSTQRDPKGTLSRSKEEKEVDRHPRRAANHNSAIHLSKIYAHSQSNAILQPASMQYIHNLLLLGGAIG